MTHQQKVERLIADLGKQGVSPYTVAPPLFRLLWSLGFEVPPPLFLGFFTVALLTGTAFGCFWGAFLWFANGHLWNLTLDKEITTSLGEGIFFGITIGLYHRWKAARLRLPRWREYPEFPAE
jgi:hypothetical protein